MNLPLKVALPSIFVFLGTSGLAHAETIDVLGQKVNFRNPAGYCSMGKSPRERELVALSERAVGEGARLVHIAVRCTELAAFNKGSRNDFQHWVQIQLLGPKGNLRRLNSTREAFLSSMAKSTARLDMVEMRRRIAETYTDLDMNVSGAQVQQVGRDGNAVYLSLRMSFTAGGSTVPVTGLAGVTLINSLPLSSIVYESTASASSRDRLQPTLQELLTSLLTEN
jgi:hypothetical protein